MGSNTSQPYKGAKLREAISGYESMVYYFRVHVERCQESLRIFAKIRPDDPRPGRELRKAEADLRKTERLLAEALAAANSAPNRLPDIEYKKLPSRLRRYYLGLKRELATFERECAERGEDHYARTRRRLENIAKPGTVFPYPPCPSECTPRPVRWVIPAVMEEGADGLDLLYHSFYYGAADFYCDAANYIGNGAGYLRANDFNRGALLLAEALTLGCWTDADRIANASRFALAERRRSRFDGQLICGFSGVDRTCVAPFVLNLYAQWSGKPFPLDGWPLLSMQLYEPLLSVWQSNDLAAVEQALLIACDFHMERSNLSETNSLEFNIPEHILFPVEILAVLRLREAKGLINPIIDHPLLQTPIGRLHEIKSVPHDQLLDRAVANYLSTFPPTVTEKLFAVCEGEE